jgi:HEAT repeat protein
MFRSIQWLVLVTAFISGRSAAATQLTKDDIPPNTPQEIRELIEKTFSENPQTREAAARQLGELHGQAVVAIPFLMRLSGDLAADEKGIAYRYAARALVTIGDPALKACITEAKAIATNPHPVHDSRVIVALSEFMSSSPEAVEMLGELLNARDPEIRRTTAIYLEGCTDTRATMPLLDVVEHGSGETRVFAVGCFKHLRDPRCVEPLIKILRGRGAWQEMWNPGLASVVAVALGCQGDRRAVPILLEIVKVKQAGEMLQHCAARSLGRIGDPSCINQLVDVLSDRDILPGARSGAALGIADFRSVAGQKIDDPQVVPSLAAVLSKKNDWKEVRVAVAQALGDLGDPRALDALCGAAKSDHADQVGFWAAINAVKLTDGAIDDLDVLRAIQDYEEYNEGHGGYRTERETALAKLSANGGWRLRIVLGRPTWLTFAVPFVSLLLIGGGVWCFFWFRLRKSKSAESGVLEPAADGRIAH